MVADAAEGMTMKRAFSMLEVVAVLAAVGVAGAIAFVSFSSGVSDARARADLDAAVLKIKSERDNAKQKLMPIIIQEEEGGVKVVRAAVLADPTTNSRVCEQTSQIVSPTIRFDAVRFASSARMCLGEDGRPIGPALISVGTQKGEMALVSVGAGGDWEVSYIRLTGDELTAWQLNHELNYNNMGAGPPAL
jgi:prepilin-type N-terminal cleavage/methylation domain-containing protein